MRNKTALAIRVFVVLVGLGGLAAVLFWPVSSRGGYENRPRAACQSNLKLIGLAIKQYVQDYDEKYPLVSAGGRGWSEVIQPYIKDEKPFYCPVNKSERVAGTIDTFYNARLAGIEERKTEFPANTIMIGDGLFDQPTNASLSAFPASWRTDTTSPAWRHLEGANYGYADGHVKWLKPDKVKNTPVDASITTFAVR
jgi:prepilin-type processing-associated H-X9-DG protein